MSRKKISRKEIFFLTLAVVIGLFWASYCTLTFIVAPTERLGVDIKKTEQAKEIQIKLDQKRDFLQNLEIPVPSDGEKIRALRSSLRREIADLEKKISGDDGVVLSKNHLP